MRKKISIMLILSMILSIFAGVIPVVADEQSYEQLAYVEAEKLDALDHIIEGEYFQQYSVEGEINDDGSIELETIVDGLSGYILETEGEVGQQPSSGDFIDKQEQETYDLEKAKKYSVLNQSQLEIDVNSKEDDEGLIVAQGFQMFSTGASLLPFGNNQTELSGRDDHSQEVGLTSVFSEGIRFGGNVYNTLHISTNGYITFGHGNSGYNPLGIAAYTRGPIIAAQFDDLDPNKGGNIYYYQDPANGYVVVTYENIRPFSSPRGFGNAESENTFQIILRKLVGSASTDFQIELRYSKLDWAQSGNNTAWPTAGWSAGNLTSYAELPQSGQPNFRDILTGTNFGVTGVYRWNVTGGWQ